MLGDDEPMVILLAILDFLNLGYGDIWPAMIVGAGGMTIVIFSIDSKTCGSNDCPHNGMDVCIHCVEVVNMVGAGDAYLEFKAL